MTLMEVPETEGWEEGRSNLFILRVQQKRSQETGDDIEPKNQHIIVAFI